MGGEGCESDDIAALAEENAKLRAEVENWKECAGAQNDALAVSNLQVDELMKAFKAIGQYIPANLDPRGEVTYQVFIPGSAIAPAWNILHGVIEKPFHDSNRLVCCCQETGTHEKEHCPGCPVHNDHPAHDDDHASYAKKRIHECQYCKGHPKGSGPCSECGSV